MGDHGSKAFEKSDALSSLLIHRNRNTEFVINDIDLTIQYFLLKLL